MAPFWGGFFELLKDCGRNASLFMITLGGLFVAIAVAGLVDSLVSPDTFRRYFAPAVPWLAVLAGLWVGMLIRRAWLRKRQRLNFRQLSSDELLKARSKLLKNRNRKGV